AVDADSSSQAGWYGRVVEVNDIAAGLTIEDQVSLVDELIRLLIIDRNEPAVHGEAIAPSVVDGVIAIGGIDGNGRGRDAVQDWGQSLEGDPLSGGACHDDIAATARNRTDVVEIAVLRGTGCLLKREAIGAGAAVVLNSVRQGEQAISAVNDHVVV